MGNFFVIADTHFSHFNIIRYCDRPFATAEEMDEALIKNWNDTVSAEDRILVLGDFGLTGRDRMTEIIARLNGHKSIMLGNHDRGKRFYQEAGFESVESRKTRLIFPPMSNHCGLTDVYAQYPDLYVVFTHVPLTVTEIDELREEYGEGGVWPRFLNVHGHIHNNESLGGPRVCVSVEVTNYKPVTLRSVVEKWLGIKEVS